jgi:hypothetical protein
LKTQDYFAATFFFIAENSIAFLQHSLLKNQPSQRTQIAIPRENLNNQPIKIHPKPIRPSQTITIPNPFGHTIPKALQTKLTYTHS